MLYSKKTESAELFFEGNLNKSLISKHYKEIIEIFEKLEEFSYLMNQRETITQIFTDSFFKGEIEVDKYGRIILSLIVNKQDLRNMNSSEWFQREKINNYILKYQTDLLRKIPVKVDELDESIRKIVKNKMQEKDKIKTLN